MSLRSNGVSLRRWSLHFVGSRDDLREGSGSAPAWCCSTDSRARIAVRCSAGEAVVARHWRRGRSRSGRLEGYVSVSSASTAAGDFVWHRNGTEMRRCSLNVHGFMATLIAILQLLPGSACRSGRRGRRFKSCHSEQLSDPSNSYGRAPRLTTAFRYFACGVNTGICRGRSCSISGDCQTFK